MIGDVPTLFTGSHCPRCTTLKLRFDKKGIMYRENTNEVDMKKWGVRELPSLLVNGEILGFLDIIKWERELEK